MSYRRSAIADLRFDERLRGKGAEVHNDLAFSLTLTRLGWKLLYDPLVEVDHYHAQRLDKGQRSNFNYVATIERVHNQTLILLEYLPPARRAAFLLWGIALGARDHRGFIQCLRFLPSEGTLAVQNLLASLQGRWQGWQTWRRGRRDRTGKAFSDSQVVGSVR